MCVCKYVHTYRETLCISQVHTHSENCLAVHKIHLKTVTACPTWITILAQSVSRSVVALTLGTGSCRRKRFLPRASDSDGLCLPKPPVLPKPCGPMWAASQAISLIPPEAPGPASCLPRVPPPLPTKGFSKACPHAPARQETVHVFLRKRKTGVLNSRFSVCPQFHPQTMMRDPSSAGPPTKA